MLKFAHSTLYILRSPRRREGFTLIELLVVISVIGILASLLLARFGTAEKSARDARRKSDLNQYRTALENFSIKTNGTYPSHVSVIIVSQESGGLCSDLGPTYLSSCLFDPRQSKDDPNCQTSEYCYRYQSNGSGLGDATEYLLWADLESNGYWYICANGTSGETSATPDSADCGF